MLLAVDTVGPFGGGKAVVTNRTDTPTQVDPTGRTPPTDGSVAPRNRWYAMDSALDKAVARVMRHLGDIDNDDFADCLSIYQDAYRPRHLRELESIAKRPLARDSIKRYNDAVNLANMYIRSWFQIALNGAARRGFDPVADIVLGLRTLPRWNHGTAEDHTVVAQRVVDGNRHV